MLLIPVPRCGIRPVTGRKSRGRCRQGGDGAVLRTEHRPSPGARGWAPGPAPGSSRAVCPWPAAWRAGKGRCPAPGGRPSVFSMAGPFSSSSSVVAMPSTSGRSGPQRRHVDGVEVQVLGEPVADLRAPADGRQGVGEFHEVHVSGAGPPPRACRGCHQRLAGDASGAYAPDAGEGRVGSFTPGPDVQAEIVEPEPEGLIEPGNPDGDMRESAQTRSRHAAPQRSQLGQWARGPPGFYAACRRPVSL